MRIIGVNGVEKTFQFGMLTEQGSDRKKMKGLLNCWVLKKDMEKYEFRNEENGS